MASLYKGYDNSPRVSYPYIYSSCSWCFCQCVHADIRLNQHVASSVFPWTVFKCAPSSSPWILRQVLSKLLQLLVQLFHTVSGILGEMHLCCFCLKYQDKYLCNNLKHSGYTTSVFGVGASTFFHVECRSENMLCLFLCCFCVLTITWPSSMVDVLCASCVYRKFCIVLVLLNSN